MALTAERPEDATRQRCPDGGYCHHECDPPEHCFRVRRCCGPLSNVYPGDRWPVSVQIQAGLISPTPQWVLTTALNLVRDIDQAIIDQMLANDEDCTDNDLWKLRKTQVHAFIRRELTR